MSDRPKSVTIIKDDERPHGIRILTEDGRDISKDLLIRKVTWTMEAGEAPIAILEVVPTRVNAKGRLVVVPVSAIADELDAQLRLGTGTDEPEGSRYLVISDTLARQLSAALRTPKP
jgi:hypothetical protein